VWGNQININLTNLNVVQTDDAKVGFLVWEGDSTNSGGETLSINGNTLSNPPLNPPTNAFNSTNSYTGASDLYNMDLDYYIIEDYINIGDTNALINLQSSSDLVVANNIVISISSELPDATIAIDEVIDECESRDIDVAYTVYNVECTDVLPANTPI